VGCGIEEALASPTRPLSKSNRASALPICRTVVGFAAYVWLLKQVSSTLVSTYTFVNPIIAVLLGWLVLGEQPSGWMIAGAALVIASVAGVLMSNPDAKNKKD
jgi:drug/metabolite transporter (DMT)-like permease